MSNYQLSFSPTGGTLKAAEAVAEGLGGEFIPLDLLKPLERRPFSPRDLCLFAVPSYGGRVPGPAVERIRRLSGCGARAVLLAVFGNRAIDDTLLELSDELERAGFRPIAGIEAVAQHSLLPAYGAGRPDEQDREELRGFGLKIREAAESGRLPPAPSLPGSRPYREYKGVPLKPSVSGGCIGCGICAAECPAGAIPAIDFRMTDGKKCISCMRCVAVCPQGARKVSRLMRAIASGTLRKSCSEPKKNKLWF